MRASFRPSLPIVRIWKQDDGARMARKAVVTNASGIVGSVGYNESLTVEEVLDRITVGHGFAVGRAGPSSSVRKRCTVEWRFSNKAAPLQYLRPPLS
jgi:hypothetical protein